MGNKSGKVVRVMVIALVCGLLFGLTYYRLWENDCFEDSSSEPGYVTELEYLGGDASAVSYKDLGQYALVAEGFEQVYLYSGTYELTIGAWTIADGCWFQVVDRWTNTVLAEGEYTPWQEYHTITFTTTSNYEDVVIRSYAPIAGVERTSGETDSETAEDSGTLEAEGAGAGEDGTSSVEEESSGTVEVEALQVINYSMTSVGPVLTDTVWELILLAAAAALFLAGLRRWYLRRGSSLLAVTVLSILTSLPFLNESIAEGHDVAFHIARIYSLGQSIAEGLIPQRVNLSMGGGTIAPILYPELLLYPAGLMVASGASVWLAYQATCVLITFLTAFLSYAAARQISDPRTAVLFSVVYTLNPYRLNELFVRSAIGEAAAVAFLPLVIVGMYRILCREERASHRAGALDLIVGYTGLISSHVITTLIAALLCAVFVLGRLLLPRAAASCRLRRFAWILLAGGIVVVLNLWFLIPFLQYFDWETKVSVASYERIEYTGPYLWQVFMGVTGYGNDNGESRATAGEMSFTLGTAALAGLLLFAYMLLRDNRLRRSSGTGKNKTILRSRVPEEERTAHPEGGVDSSEETIGAWKPETVQRSDTGQTEETAQGTDMLQGEQTVPPERPFLTEEERGIGAGASLLALLFLYLCSPYCPWELLCESSGLIASTFGGIQYSWRFLTVVVVMVSAVLAVVLRALNRRGTEKAGILSAGLLFLCLLTAVQTGTEYYEMDAYMEDRFDAEIFWNYDYALSYVQCSDVEDWILSGEGPSIAIVSDAGSDAAAGDEDGNSDTSADAEGGGSPGEAVITAYQRVGAGYTFSFVNTTGQDLVVTVPVYWYGLHTAYLSEDSDAEGGETGLENAVSTVTQFTQITIPGDVTEGTVNLRYTEPWYYAAAEWISLLTPLTLTVVTVIGYRRGRRYGNTPSVENPQK